MSSSAPEPSFAEILGALADPAMVTDAAGTILAVNPAFEAMTGYSAGEVLGRKPSVLKSGLHPAEFYADLWRTVTTGRAWRGVISNRRKDGAVYQCEETISPLRGADGALRGFVAIERDVSARLSLEAERERTAAAVARGEAMLRAVFQAMPIGVRVLDAAGDLVYSNPEARRIVGGADAVQGGRVLLRGVWSETGSPVAPEEWPLTQAFLSGRPQLHRSILLSGLDGVERHILVSAFPLSGPDGRPASVFSFVQDISELQEIRRALTVAETSLQRSGRLEVIGRLAAGVSHDFNNSLSIINGLAEFVRAALPPSHPALADVAEIVKAVARAKSLTGQLLAFGRRQTLEPRSLAVAEVLDGVARLMKGFLGVKIFVETRIECAPGRRVWADACQLENALINFAVNARDAMPQGGTVTLRAADVVARPAGAARDAAFVEVSVTDTGTGIPPEVLSRVFEPFFTTKPPGKGTGLGLATAYGFARQSGGDLLVENRPEGGVRVALLLPAHEEAGAAPAAAAPVPAPQSRGREKLLVVDDEATIASVIRRMLTAAGYEVVQFTDPLVAARSPEASWAGAALLITDIRMPAMSGPRLAARFSAALPGLRVLYMSGYLEGSREPELADGPPGRFIHKPFSRQDLLIAVREAIDGPPERPASA